MGRKIDSNLNIYRGTFKNSTKHGFGILDRILDKQKYEGMFEHGVEHGFGREFVFRTAKFDASTIEQSNSFEAKTLQKSMSENLQKSLTSMRQSHIPAENPQEMAEDAPKNSCSKLDFVSSEDLEQLYEGE